MSGVFFGGGASACAVARRSTVIKKQRARKHNTRTQHAQHTQHSTHSTHLEDEVAELLELDRRLERQLQLGARDDDVWKVEQVHLERVEHALARDDDALGLLLDRQAAHERRDLLGRLPLGELREALLAGPHARVDDL